MHGTPKVSTSKVDGVTSDTARPPAPGEGKFALALFACDEHTSLYLLLTFCTLVMQILWCSFAYVSV